MQIFEREGHKGINEFRSLYSKDNNALADVLQMHRDVLAVHEHADLLADNLHVVLVDMKTLQVFGQN